MVAQPLTLGALNSLTQRYDDGLVRFEVEPARRPRPAIADRLVRGEQEPALSRRP